MPDSGHNTLITPATLPWMTPNYPHTHYIEHNQYVLGRASVGRRAWASSQSSYVAMIQRAMKGGKMMIVLNVLIQLFRLC